MRNTVLLYIGLLVICAGIIPKCNATTAGEDLGMTTEATTLPPLGEPENVRANGESTTSIRVTWEEASGDPDRYTITGTGVTEKDVEADPSGTYNVTVTVDTPGTTYIITVTAIRDEDGAKKAAEGTTASTNPNPPNDVELSPIDTESIQVEWKAPDEGAFSKYFAKACAGDNCAEPEEFQNDAQSGNIEGLTAGTLYTVTMWTQFEDLDSEETVPKGQATMPKPPIDVELSPIDTGSIQVEWKAPDEGSASKYFGKACAGDDCLEQELTQGPPVDIISGLTAGTLYTVTMLSQFEDLNSTETEGKTQATMPEAPTDVTITVTGEDTMDITWTSASSDHKITITGKPCNPSLDEQGGCDSDCDGHGSITDFSVSGKEHPATDLYAGRLYEVTVKAVENGVDSEPSVPSSNRTEPKPPASVTEKSTTTTTATLTITPPFDLECTQSSEFKGYKIRGVKDDDIYVPSNSAENVDHEIKELKDATEFQYTVVTVSGDSDVESDPIDGLIFKTKLHPATDLKLTSDRNSITLTWEGEGDDYTYSVECKDSDGNGNHTDTTTDNTYTFDDLTHGEVYTCTVVSVQSGFEQDGKIEEKNILLNPFKPTLTVTPIDTTSLRVSWTKEGLVDSNTLTFNETDWSVDNDVTVTNITNLEPNGVYVIVLEVTSGNNTETDSATSQTLSNAVALEVDDESINSKNMTLKWGFPDGNAQDSLLYAYYVKVLNDENACLKSYLLMNDQGITSPAEPSDCDPTKTNPMDITGPIEFQVPELRPCTLYKFEVTPVNTVALGTTSDTKSGTTTVGAPEGDINLQFESSTETSITFTWTVPAEPVNCDKRSDITITYENCSDSSGADIVRNYEDVKENSYTEENMQAFWDYTVKVKVLSVFGGTNETVEEEDTFKTQSADPVEPTNFRVEGEPTKDTVTLKWDKYDLCKVNGGNPKYNLVCEYIDPLKDGDTSEVHINETIGQEVITLDILYIYKNYTCKLYIVTDQGRSSAVQAKFQTKEYIPSQVTAITKVESHNEIIITWPPPKEPNGVIIRNVICWYEEVDNPIVTCDESLEFVTDSSEYTHTIDGLEAFRYFEFNVSACTIVDCGNASDNVDAQTKNGRAVSTTVRAVPAGSDKININWDKPEVSTADVTDYMVIVYDDDDDVIMCNKTVEGFDSESTTCLELDAWWKYRVELDIITYEEQKRGGHWMVNSDSSPAFAVTEEAAPGKVQNVEYAIADKKICRFVQVSVQEPLPRDKNGNITKYTITPLYGEEGTPDDNIFECSYETCGITDGQFTKDVDVDANEEILSFQVKAYTSDFEGSPDTSEGGTRSLCPPEIPSGGGNNSVIISDNQDGVDNTKQLKVNIDRYFFNDETNGKITHRGIIVSDSEKTDDNNADNDIANWDRLKEKYPAWAKSNQEPELKPYRATVDGWNPFSGNRQKRQADTETFTIGEDGACDKAKEDVYCNGPLKPGRSYKVRSVRCTAGGCMVSKYAADESAPLGVPPDIGLIVGMTIFALLLVAVIVGALYMWRSKRWPFKESSSSNDRTTGYNGAHENPIFEPEGKPDVVNALYFPEYVKDLHKDSGLKFTEQYESIKTHCAKKSMDVSTEPENRAKNRYVNILPFDFSRVKLLPQDDVPGSDYINANYMPGYNGPREFIATQGPLVCTMNDFWRMVWEQRSHIIVMLTQLTQQGRSKCDQYWPKGNEPVYYGDLAVKTVSESVLGDYTIRILEVQLGSDKRTIKQFHMTSWPDFGCPDTTDILLNFTRVVRADVRPGAGPITVHCSAGVGRTGTYIAVDRLLQHIETHDDIDIYGITMEMRDYRSYMVQTEDQYIYIHDCLKDVLEARNKQEDEDENIYENTGQTPQVEEEENIYENSNHKGNVTTDPNGHHYDNNKKALYRMSSPP